MNRIDIIQAYINIVGAKTYLEIGVRNGDSFLPIRCQHKIGVDIQINSSLLGKDDFYEMSSDEFFRHYPKNFDVAFIDGDHSHQHSLSDLLNCLAWVNVGGAIILHDCNPTSEDMASPEFGKSANWCGEVWKTITYARTFHSLNTTTFNCDFWVAVVEFLPNKNILDIDLGNIQNLTYKDLEKNRKDFLILVDV